MLAVLDGTHKDILVRTFANLHPSGERDQFIADLVVHVIMHVKPFQRRAGLAAIYERAPEKPLGDLLGVDVRENDSGVVSAEFKGQPLHGFRRVHHDLLAGRAGAGENDLADPLVRRHCGAKPVLAGDAVDHALPAIPRS